MPAAPDVSQPGYGTDEMSVRSGVPLTPLSKDVAPQYLESYGYRASSPTVWKQPMSVDGQSLQITVHSSSIMLGHVWYLVRFTITVDTSTCKQWTVPRRLCHFREGLHAHVVHGLPKAVRAKYFRAAPFALRGGLPGTGKRLRAWCEALAVVINEGQVSPALVARCLRWGEREKCKTWSLVGMGREGTGTSREGTGVSARREGTWASREGTWASREGSFVSREGALASREGSLASREGGLATRESSLESRASMRTQRGTAIPLGGYDFSSSGEATMRFGTPLPPIPRAAVPKYLESFGYVTSDPEQWVKPSTSTIWPKLSFTAGHRFEMLAQTWYCVHVSISTSGSDSSHLESKKETSWTVPRRHCHFQDGLLDYVKSLPSAVSKEHFRGTPFAHLDGIPGTAGRLNGWCAALSAVINSGQAPPYFVALCLRWAEHPTVVPWGRAVPHQDMGVEGKLMIVIRHGEADQEVVVDDRSMEVPLQLDEPPQTTASDSKASEDLLIKSKEEDIIRVLALREPTAPDVDV